MQEAEYPSSYYYDMVCLGWQLIRFTNEFSRTMCGSGGEKTYVLVEFSLAFETPDSSKLLLTDL